MTHLKICIHQNKYMYNNNKIIRGYSESFKLNLAIVIIPKAVKNAINLYNNERLHLPLGYKNPNLVYKNVI